jgi:hypothetical protein
LEQLDFDGSRGVPSVPARPQRVLCYAPYNRWALHGQWEMTVLKSLELRGADVHYVLCDGLYTDCDMFWAATDPRPPNACTHCQADVTQLVRSMGMDFEWLGRYLTLEERREARRWERSLARKELRHARYGDWEVAAWIASSVHSHFRRSRLDLDQPEVEDAVRSYLFSELVACFALDRLLDDQRPDVLFLFNGRQSSTRVAFELARRRGIRVVCHERGPRKETLTLAVDERCISLGTLDRFWHEWQDVPLTIGEIADLDAQLSARERGTDSGFRTFSPPLQSLDDVRARLGLRADRPVWVLFTSSDDEVVAEDEWQGPFATQHEWIERTVAYVAAHPELDLVVRAHPNTASRRSTGANLVQLQELTELGRRLPPNARMVMPDEELSSYTLMDIATVGLAYHSTVALELACKGKETVVAGANTVAAKRFVRTVENAARYEELLESLLRLAPGAISVEVRRLAWRYAYGRFFRTCVPFPLVHMPDGHTGVLTYSTLDTLRPGRDENLDRVARILLHGEPTALPPGEAELARSDADERTFFGLDLPDTEAAVQVDDDPAAPAAGTSPVVAEGRQAGSAPAPRVSVVVPCFNYGCYLEGAVESVLAQTYRDLEVIIVDDGSTDDSLAVARRLAAAHEQVTVLAQENSGQPAISRNNGIARARGEYILTLDADDVIEPDFVERLASTLDGDESVSIAYGDQQNFGEDATFHVHAEYDFAQLAHCNFIGIASLYRREAWENVGGYATNVRGYEDWDFWIGCGEQGHVGRRVPGAVFRYRVRAGSLFDDARQRDAVLKAQIVLNHPRLYGEVQAVWARGVLAGNPAALALNPRLIVIPDFGRPIAPPALHGVRGTAVLAFADELVECPDLLARYAQAFDGQDDVTLVIAVPDEPSLVPRLEQAAAAAGLDTERSADLLAVPCRAPWEIVGLGARMLAIYTAREPLRPLRRLTPFDQKSLGELRQLTPGAGVIAA